jgi:hypothetical protein
MRPTYRTVIARRATFRTTSLSLFWPVMSFGEAQSLRIAENTLCGELAQYSLIVAAQNMGFGQVMVEPVLMQINYSLNAHTLSVSSCTYRII